MQPDPRPAERWRRWFPNQAILRAFAIGLILGALLGLAVALIPLPPTARAAAQLILAAAMTAWLAMRLRQRDRQLALLGTHGRNPILWLDDAGRIRGASEACGALFDIPPAALIGQTFATLCHPDDAAALCGLLAMRPAPTGPLEPLLRLRGADGSWLAAELTLAEDPGGGLICALRDVSRWQQAVAAARASERDYALIAEQAGDMIVRVRPDRTRAYVSPAANEVLGYSAAALYDMDFTQIVHPEDRARVGAAFTALVHHGGQTTCRFRMEHRTRGWIWVESRWTGLATGQPNQECDQGHDVVAIVRDISARVAAEESSAYLARHDPLTGLANRALFAERTEAALTHALILDPPPDPPLALPTGVCAVLCLDLDLFKSVNDTLGHAAGDALLCEVARRLSACARQTDTVARLGGDEFAILLPGAERVKDAAALAGRVLVALAEPVMLEGRAASISASVGIALAPEHGADYDTLLRRADAALYRAKARGRGQWQLFAPALEHHRRARDRTVTELRQAVGSGAFVLHYLPTVALDTGRFTGFEALLRWDHPERGLLRPGTFLRLAEETGLIAPIGALVLRQAAEDAARWPCALPVAVNFSAAQLRTRGLATSVLRTLAAAGLAPERLEIEITEPILTDDDRGAMAELHRLRAAGVRLALDDFGSGHGALRYLRRVPVDRIKLDRSFVQDLSTNRTTREIARAMASLAQGLGIVAAAEGVETAEQRDLLHTAGYDEAQGFLFSRPVPAAAVAALLAPALVAA